MNTFKKINISILLMAMGLMVNFNCFSQVPDITNVSIESGSVSQSITITGSNFNNDPNNLRVFFGAVIGRVTFASAQVLEVEIPSGTTFHRISVTDLTTGLTGYASEQFFLSYGGQNGIASGDFETQLDFAAESGLYDLCMCDFNNDGLSEVVTANDNANSLSFFNNSSIIGSINLTKSPLLINKTSINVNCGDLNGDGKPDLIISEGNNVNRIHIYKNTTVGVVISFSLVTPISVPGTVARRLEINDMDGDGKPEIIVSNPGGNVISIIHNQSNISTITMSGITSVTIPGASSTLGLAVEDLNADGRPDIVTNQFLTNNGNIFVVENASTPGNYVFNNVTTLAIPGTMVNVKIGDVDGDGKSDIVATQLTNSTLSIIRNQSSPNGAISFAAYENFTVPNRTWGIDLGDIDGDGIKDIVLGSIGDQKTITILNNNSSPGNLSFIKTEIPTTWINRNVKVGDIDGDAKPDILFTSVDDTNLGVFSSELSILRNKGCFIPEIENESPFTICANTSVRLTSTQAPGITYSWQRNADAPVVGTDPFFDVALAGDYTVTAISELGTCNQTSAAVTVVIDASSAPTGIVLGANTPICLGQTLNLTATNFAGASYSWEGPDNFTSNQQNPSLSSFDENMVGIYSLTATVGNCESESFDIVIESSDSPSAVISNNGTNELCSGSTTQLSVTSNPSYTYVWKRDGIAIPGAIANTYDAGLSGSYTVEVTDTDNVVCPVVESAAVDIKVYDVPDAAISVPSNACAGESISFMDLSTVDADATVSYNWDFGDGNSSTTRHPTHSFSSGGMKTITLVVSYSEVSCSDLIVGNIDITDSGTIDINTTDDILSICSGNDLQLNIVGTYSGIMWNTGATTPNITVNQAGTYSVDANTLDGCPATGQITIAENTPPTVNILAEKTIIKEGESLQLTVEGLVDVTWVASDSIDDVNSLTPIIKPSESATYAVSGFDENGCYGESSIDIEVQLGLIVDKINPHKLFSPNNDSVDDFWIIDEIENYPDCHVTLFDQKGIKIFESKPYDNSWDASLNGKQLPQGVYYYVVQCGDNEDRISGSVTVIR